MANARPSASVDGLLELAEGLRRRARPGGRRPSGRISSSVRPIVPASSQSSPGISRLAKAILPAFVALRWRSARSGGSSYGLASVIPSAGARGRRLRATCALSSSRSAKAGSVPTSTSGSSAMVWTMANSCSMAAWTSGSSTPCSARNTIVPGCRTPTDRRTRSRGCRGRGCSRSRAAEVLAEVAADAAGDAADDDDGEDPQDGDPPSLAEAPGTKASEHAETSGGKGGGRVSRSSADDRDQSKATV